MTQEHPITPPPELVQQWFLGSRAMPVDQWVTDVATQAARWGADQELEACCAILELDDSSAREDLYLCRRKHHVNLKNKALEAHYRLLTLLPQSKEDFLYDLAIIRRALEELDD